MDRPTLTVTSYILADGTAVKVGDRIRVVTEGTVTNIELADHSPYIEYENGSDAAAVYPNDGEFVSLTVLKPEVKTGQVWRVASYHGLSKSLTFQATRRSIEGGCIKMWPCDLYTHGWMGLDEFFNVYPEAQLVYDPEA